MSWLKVRKADPRDFLFSLHSENPKVFKTKQDESSVCVGVNPGNPGNDCVISAAHPKSCPELALSLFRVFNQHHDTASSTPKLGNFNDCESFVLRAVSRNGHTVWTCAFLRGEGSCRQCGNGLTAE